MQQKIRVDAIFNGLGVPNVTYVTQDNGKYEQILKQGINESGTLCLITGSSKTGKTTLYNKVLESLGREPLIVRCDSSVETEEFWKRPLEKIDFSRIKELEKSNTNSFKASTKVSGKLGWGWLAELIGEVSLGIEKNQSETEKREKIIAKPSPDHLIPLLKYSNAILVVEDFHYLDEKVQKQIFQQWKVFTDNQVTVLVIGTTHHGVDLAYANPDLVGRIQQIDLKRWSNEDLELIAQKGFDELCIKVPTNAIRIISRESSGLPIITQQACGQLFIDKQLEEVKINSDITFTSKEAHDALHHVAITRYKQFESWYSRLTEGPRRLARKYNTYELVLSAFTLDPLKFELKRSEIDERLNTLESLNTRASDFKKPPAASVNSTLSALEKFQNNNGFELLEWSKRDQVIYVIEPAFLFFLRWRKKRSSTPKLMDVIYEFLKLVQPK